ncbi:flavoprotein [Xylariaceae sp. FL0255]|nr:flavoprotein [Xylariaceae sp. FL0255]
MAQSSPRPPEQHAFHPLLPNCREILTTNSSSSSLRDIMPPNRMRKLRLLVAANGPRDVAYAQAIAVRLLKDPQIETRALVDEVPARLTHEIIVLDNLSLNARSGGTSAIRRLGRESPDVDDERLWVKEGKRAEQEAAEQARQTAYDLVEWADLLVLAPIDADNLAKMMCGAADTMLLEVMRNWDVSKKILLVPGMSVHAWENPMTKKQLSKIKRKWNWIKVMAPILWHYEGPDQGQGHGQAHLAYRQRKRIVLWDGFNDLVGIIKNQAELMSLGHDVEVAAKKAMRTISPMRRVAKALPPEIWSIIFEHVGDWEIATALNVYTTLRVPADWKKDLATLTDPIEIYMYELEWMILSCPGQSEICKKLSEAPKGLRYVSSLVVKLIMKFSLIEVLSYLETNLSKVFWASFSAKFLPNKASGVYGRADLLEWWNTSPSFLKKEYDAEALDNASRMGYVHVLDWWLRSGLPLKYTEAALETASKEGHLLVLEWWKEAAIKNDSISLKPGRSLLTAAQHGQTAVLRWWESSGIPVGHGEGVAKIAGAHGQTAVLDVWHELKGEKLIYDSQVLVAPTKQGHVSVLEWWKQYARGELGSGEGMGMGEGEREDGGSGKTVGKADGRTHRVEYKTCDIEEALEDAIGDPRPVRRWWALNGLNLGLGTSEWMKVRLL